MPTLQEYIGSLVSSISDARMMSDARSAMLAEEYAKHPILQHFSIPRMRIDDVEMEIAVSLDNIDEVVQTTVEPIDNTKVNSLVYKEIVAGMGLKKLPLAASRTLKSAIAERTKNLESAINIKSDISPLQDFVREIANQSMAISKTSGIKEVSATAESIASRIEKSVTPAISLTEIKSRRLNVTAETKQLSEQKPECFIKVKMKISETGLEWTKMEDSEGKEITKLLPE